MDDKDSIEEPKKENKWGAGGGLYRSVKVSVKTLNWVIGVLIVALVGVVIYLASSSHYSVTFDTDGGNNISVYQCKYGEYIQVETPSKTGYTFSGWYQDVDKTKPWDLKNDIVKENITLYASWTPSLIHVMFDLDGGTVDQQLEIPSIDISFNETYGILPIPQKKGKTFAGWQYNGTIIENNTKMTMNGEHTLKAVWE